MYGVEYLARYESVQSMMSLHGAWAVEDRNKIRILRGDDASGYKPTPGQRLQDTSDLLERIGQLTGEGKKRRKNKALCRYRVRVDSTAR